MVNYGMKILKVQSDNLRLASLEDAGIWLVSLIA